MLSHFQILMKMKAVVSYYHSDELRPDSDVPAIPDMFATSLLVSKLISDETFWSSAGV